MTFSHRIQSYQSLYGLIRKHHKLVFGFIVMTLLSLSIEGIGVGAIISMLDGWGEGGIVKELPFLEDLRHQMNSWDLIYRLRVVAVILLVLVLLAAAAQYVKLLLAVHLQLRVETELKSKLIRQFYDLSLRYLNLQPNSHLASLFLSETTRSARMLFLIANMAAASTILALYTMIMLVISWQLTVIAAVLLVILGFASRLLISSEKLHAQGRAIVASRKRLHTVVTENISMVKLAHLYSQESQSINRIQQANDDYLTDYYDSQKDVLRSKPLFSILAVLGLATLLIASTFLLSTENDSWVASTSVFVLLVFRLLGPATELNGSHAEYSHLYPSFLSVQDFLTRENKSYLSQGNQEFRGLQTGIHFENVTFRYADNRDPALDNVTLDIPRGKKTAIVGASGCGKSTLINLLARLYDPDDGQITVDQWDLRQLQIHSWRRQIAVVTQEILLHNTSLLENLKFASPEVSDDDAIEAAKIAQMNDFVRTLPQRYNTIIGERGMQLSGGQQQRLAIARALTANPSVLILDEATSALDSETEQLIKNAIDTFARNRTAVIAAHRLSTIRDADNIVVLFKGGVVEEGTHDDLMSRKGHYWQLVNTQNIS